jgi:peroxiredoxin
MNRKLTPGDKAPDFRFDSPWKGDQVFYQTLADKPAVVVFLRYFGCPICRMEMAGLKKKIELFHQKGAGVFVVLQSSPATMASLSKQEDWPFTIICDPDARIFRLYHVEPGGLLKYLHPAGLIAAIKATFQGFMHGKFEGRETQLPAAFTIAADKTILFSYYGQNISDTPPPETLAVKIKK